MNAASLPSSLGCHTSSHCRLSPMLFVWDFTLQFSANKDKRSK
jgi:hypothetical protein